MATQFPLALDALTPSELEFLDYFIRIPDVCLRPVEDLYGRAGPRGYGVSLLLARMLKVKEGIASDHELCERLRRIRLYQLACRLDPHRIPGVSTFSEFRDRLGPIGYRTVQHRFVEVAHTLGLLDPPLPGLPRNRRAGILLLADSSFLLTAGSTTGEKQADGGWKFTDPTARFGRMHPHHRYAVGHRTHTLTAVTGVPLVSRVVSANEADITQLPALVAELCDRYPRLRFAYLILDAGYDAEEAYRLVFEEYGIIPVIIQVKEAKAKTGFTRDWRPLCPFNFALRRTGIDYQRRRTRWACLKLCRKSDQTLLFDCEHLHSAGAPGLVRYTRFRDSYRTFGPAAPNTQLYEFLKPLRTGIERTYGLVKTNRYRMEVNNTYVGADNVLMHVVEHDLVLTHDIIYDYLCTGNKSPVLDVERRRARDKSKPWTNTKPKKRKKDSRSAAGNTPSATTSVDVSRIADPPSETPASTPAADRRPEPTTTADPPPAPATATSPSPAPTAAVSPAGDPADGVLRGGG
ncbi:MAG: transposase [Myxococcota bacterium]|nr:transposase [Myxococcota bacterium]